MTDPLFELLTPAPVLPPLQDQRLGQVGAKWALYRGRHTPCDHCVQLVHELGVGKAPAPAAAAHKRSGVLGKADVMLLCNRHAQDMREKDAAALAAQNERKEHLEHVKKAARTRV